MRLRGADEGSRKWLSPGKWPENILALVEKYPVPMLLLAMGITCVFVYFPFLFQGQLFLYSDVGSDTQNVYYPFFMSMARKIAEGDLSLWNFEHGFGTNLLTRQSDVTNVFTWIACIFGADGIKYGLVYAHILKILITGCVCYWYLDNFDFSAVSKAIASYVFAFNGFTVLWGQHYTFGTACLYIVLMLFAIERAFRGGKGYLWVVFATFTVMRNTYYLAYMVLLVAAVYALFRLFAMYSVREAGKVLKKIGGLLLAVIIGGCMAAVVFLPSVALILGTSNRVTGGMSLMEKLVYYTTEYTYDRPTLWGILSRFFSNNLLGIGDYSGQLNYYEMPQWFFSSFSAFFAAIFAFEIFLDKQERKKVKVLKLIAAAMLCALAFHPFLSLVLNGFVSPFFRYTFVVLPFFALGYAETLDKLLYGQMRLRKTQILCALGISAGLLLLSIVKNNTPSPIGRMSGLLYLGMMVALALVLLVQKLGKATKLWQSLCILGVVAIFAANICAESYVATNARGYTSRENPRIYLTGGNDEVRQALAYIDETETEFCRTEKLFKDVSFLNDSMLEGYYGISVYNSVVNVNTVRFIWQVCPEFKAIPPEGYYDFAGIWDNESLIPLLGVKYVLSYEDISDAPQYTYVKSFGDLKLYKNEKTTGVAQFFANAIPYAEFAAIEDMSQRQKLLADTLVIDDLPAAVIGADAQAEVSFGKPARDNLVEGTVNAEQDGWVFLSIPNEIGWRAYVDGQEAELLRADIAFCAVAVPEGTHTVQLRYTTPLLKEGAVISCVGLVLFGLWGAWLVAQDRKEKK